MEGKLDPRKICGAEGLEATYFSCHGSRGTCKYGYGSVVERVGVDGVFMLRKVQCGVVLWLKVDCCSGSLLLVRPRFCQASIPKSEFTRLDFERP